MDVALKIGKNLGLFLIIMAMVVVPHLLVGAVSTVGTPSF